MRSFLKTPDWIRAGAGLLVLSMAWSVGAYPPAPHHVIFGLVRDEMGNPLGSGSAEIILETLSGIQVKTQVSPGLQPGVNYRLAVPLDSGITDDLYRPTALRPWVPFRVKVRIGQTVYLPIEMKGDYSKLGLPGQTTRINLTLGEDANGNGLPDAWERALIAQLGGSKSLNDIRPGDDSLGHGLSNLEEYIAGTYTITNRDGFNLQIVRKVGETARLEFMVIRGRSYTIYSSPDLSQWKPVQFSIPALGADFADLPSFYATESRVLQVEALPESGQPAARYFRLMVQ